MCYLIAKNFNNAGCVALQMKHGPELVALKKKIANQIGYDKIQLVTISRPSAYGEYEPYQFVNSSIEFEKKFFKIIINRLYKIKIVFMFLNQISLTKNHFFNSLRRISLRLFKIHSCYYLAY